MKSSTCERRWALLEDSLLLPRSATTTAINRRLSAQAETAMGCCRRDLRLRLPAPRVQLHRCALAQRSSSVVDKDEEMVCPLRRIDEPLAVFRVFWFWRGDKYRVMIPHAPPVLQGTFGAHPYSHFNEASPYSTSTFTDNL